MVYIKFGNCYMIRQNAKLKWPPNILVIRYMLCMVYEYVNTAKRQLLIEEKAASGYHTT